MEDFINLVAAMREHQKMFFSTKSRHHLEQSKNYEKMVDAKIKDLKSGQVDMFNEEAQET